MGALENNFKLKVDVWVYPGLSGWHFVSIPKKQSEQIKKTFGNLKRGWGSLPVLVSCGKTSWKTSIFPESKSGTYLLPIKSKIRKLENIMSGDTILLQLKILA